MRRTGNIWLTTMLALLSIAFASAQETAFTASLDKNPVAMSDVFKVQYTLENARGDIRPPSFADFDVVFGPSTSSSVQIINGRQSMSTTLTYALRPRATGKFTIGPAVANVAGKAMQTESLTVEVVAGSGASQAQQQGSGGQNQQQAPASADPNLMVRTQLSKNKVYQGEGILISFVLLSRYNNIDIGNTEFPTLDGFWSEEIKSGASSWENDFEYIKGVPYRKAILRQQLLFPQRSGTMEIEPFKLSARVNRSFFNPGTEVSARSYKQSIEVLPLPAGAPASFNGAVGDYAFSGKVGKTELQANDAIDLNLSLKGKGNLKLARAPSVNFPGDFEVYDPELKDRIATNTGGMNGSRSWEYLVIPRYPGKYELPKIEFTHFNVSKQRYVTESIGPFQIEVSGEDGVVPEQRGAIARSRVEPVSSEIRYLSTNTEGLSLKGKMFFGSVWYYFLTFGPLFIFAGAVIFYRKRKAMLGDVKAMRRRKAHHVAKKRLEAAHIAMQKGESQTFYSEIFSAMYGFLADKLGSEKAALTKPMIREKFTELGVADHVAQEAMYIIETCEMARFAPTAGQSDQVFYGRVSEFIENLEGQFK